MLAELRVIAELSAGSLYSKKPSLTRPKGDGRPVVIIPGFLGGDSSTTIIRRVLKEANYDVYGANLDANPGLKETAIQALEQHCQSIYKATGCKVTLIGHSAGGMLARIVGRRQAPIVRHVISIGSPFKANLKVGFGGLLGRAHDAFTNRKEVRQLVDNGEYHAPLPVPTTSIFSKGDAFANWKFCLEVADEKTENIRVIGSHSGMLFNPLVLDLLLNRLQEPEENWQPYAAHGITKYWVKPICAKQHILHWVIGQ